MAETNGMSAHDQPLLVAECLSKNYGRLAACRDVSFALYPGEVLAVVGESGSGKSTLLQLLSAQLVPSGGRVSYCMRDGVMRNLATLGEAERRFLFRTDWGYVHQDPAQGLRMAVSAGANVGERLMAVGWNHYGYIRDAAANWDGTDRVDDYWIYLFARVKPGTTRQQAAAALNSTYAGLVEAHAPNNHLPPEQTRSAIESLLPIAVANPREVVLDDLLTP